MEEQLEHKYSIIGGGITAPKGFKACGLTAGIKKNGKKDLALIYSEVVANSAGVFTTNKVKAAPLLITMENLEDGKAQAAIVNSGNANACTGKQGYLDALETVQTTAEALGIKDKDVLVSSTGVIGVQLPVNKVIDAIPTAVKFLSIEGNKAAAEAIMTTDTFMKEVAVQFQIAEQTVSIGAMAKGSGMIHPNMATMLGFVTTDVNIEQQALQQALKYAVGKSFNMITVDGDTSTNDMVVAMANGLSENPEISLDSENYYLFREVLAFTCTYLAKEIARDGEGATKLLEVIVENAPTEEDARKAALAVAKSSLVKTAIFGEDANWGRIIAAVGYSGAEFQPDLVDIFLGSEKMAEKGCGLPFDEAKAKKILEEKFVTIKVNLNFGTQGATAWGCDLSYDYVKINADYRT